MPVNTTTLFALWPLLWPSQMPSHFRISKSLKSKHLADAKINTLNNSEAQKLTEIK